MLRFYEESYVCHIIIDNSFASEDLQKLETLFEEEYSQWFVEFVNIYTLDASIIEILYSEIFLKQKDIVLHPQKERLTHYLHKLGFKTFSSLEHKEAIVDAQSIEVILIGGSMDSFEKIVAIVKQCNFENLSLVIVQHQQAEGRNSFDKILQPYTSHKVSYAKEMQQLQKGRIYLAPHNKHLLVENGYCILSDAPKYNFAKPSISLSYESFSNYYKNSLVIIQECGYVNDGVDKLSMLQNNGSKIIIQNQEECAGEARSMVVHALQEKRHNYLFHLQEIIAYIHFLNTNYSKEEYIIYLMQQIRLKFGYDLREYHHEMLQRRLETFMIKRQTKSFKNIVGDILFNQTEFKKFLLEVSINVTEFFRNPQMYKDLKEILLTSFQNRKNIKIWSAGCSSGQEAISLAILLENVAKFDKSIIYATDFNKTIIEEAKNGLYDSSTYEKAKENLTLSRLNISLKNYFSINANFVTVQPFIKEKILYFEHNLVTDSSFNEFDIIVCGNVLIYFEEALQKRVFELFYNSLKFGGYLILGEKELLHHDYSSKFERYNNTTQIYKKIR